MDQTWRLVASTLNKESTETEGFYYWRTNAFNTQHGREGGDPDEAWLRAVAFAPPVWSPDGERLAFLVNEGQHLPYRRVLYTARADGTEMTRIAETMSVRELIPPPKANSLCDGLAFMVSGWALCCLCNGQ